MIATKKTQREFDRVLKLLDKLDGRIAKLRGLREAMMSRINRIMQEVNDANTAEISEMNAQASHEIAFHRDDLAQHLRDSGWTCIAPGQQDEAYYMLRAEVAEHRRVSKAIEAAENE